MLSHPPRSLGPARSCPGVPKIINLARRARTGSPYPAPPPWPGGLGGAKWNNASQPIEPVLNCPLTKAGKSGRRQLSVPLPSAHRPRKCAPVGVQGRRGLHATKGGSPRPSGIADNPGSRWPWLPSGWARPHKVIARQAHSSAWGLQQSAFQPTHCGVKAKNSTNRQS